MAIGNVVTAVGSDLGQLSLASTYSGHWVVRVSHMVSITYFVGAIKGFRLKLWDDGSKCGKIRPRRDG